MKKVFLSLAFMLVAGVGTISAHPVTVTLSNGMKFTLKSSKFKNGLDMAIEVARLENAFGHIDMSIINKDISYTPEFW